MEQRFKGELTMAILENLVRGALTTKALILAFIKAGRSSYWLRKNVNKELRKSETDYYEFLDLQRLYKLINKLRKDGLVESHNKSWTITKFGYLKLNVLKSRFLHKEASTKKETDVFKVIIFDVPEKYKSDREWLRSTLKNFGMTALQKSVFIGNAKLPTCFIKDLDERKILHHVQIFTVSKNGTLKNLISS